MSWCGFNVGGFEPRKGWWVMYGTYLFVQGGGKLASRCIGYVWDEFLGLRAVVVLLGTGALCVAVLSQSGHRFLGAHDIPADCAAGWLTDAVGRGVFEALT